MKIKISMDTNPNLSDEEIRTYMNFDKLVESVKHSARHRPRKIWFVIPIAAVVLVSSLWLIHHKAGENSSPQPASGPNTTGENAPNHERSALRNVEEKERADDGALSDKVQQAENVHAGEQDHARADERSLILPEKVPGEKGKAAASSADPVRGGAKLSSAEEDVYIQAAPREGYTHLYTYFSEHLVYPPQAIKDSISGVETISFTIDELGKPSAMVITKSLGAAFDAEALRLISNMPAWQPATLNGKAVASQLSLPLTFQVKRIK